MLTLGIYVILGLACAGILFFVSVAVFGGSTTARPPLSPEEAAEAAAQHRALEPERSDLAPAVRDGVPVELPKDRAITGEDVDRLRLPVALRGYRMAETDEALDRLARELRERDATIAQLRAPAAGSPDGRPATPASPDPSSGGSPAASPDPSSAGSPAASADPSSAGSPAASPAASPSERR